MYEHEFSEKMWITITFQKIFIYKIIIRMFNYKNEPQLCVVFIIKKKNNYTSPRLLPNGWWKFLIAATTGLEIIINGLMMCPAY